MPNLTMYTTQGFETTSDNRWTPADNGAQKLNTADIAAVNDIIQLDAYLVTLNAAYWTTARLNQESLWDKLYWMRVNRRGTASLT